VRPPNRTFRFEATLLRAGDDCIILEHEARPSKPLNVGGEEVMASGYRVVWFLFNGKPYDIGRFYRPDGTWTGYYVDILEPVRWQDADPDTLEPIVDLFLDLWITPDGEGLILDEDELEEAVRQKAIPPERAGRAREVAERLLEATLRGDFPPEIVRKFAG
jgi:predicted RNA-binding protein associated with RNAse of E/G family